MIIYNTLWLGIINHNAQERRTRSAPLTHCQKLLIHTCQNPLESVTLLLDVTDGGGNTCGDT